MPPPMPASPLGGWVAFLGAMRASSGAGGTPFGLELRGPPGTSERIRLYATFPASGSLLCR